MKLKKKQKPIYPEDGNCLESMESVQKEKKEFSVGKAGEKGRF